MPPDAPAAPSLPEALANLNILWIFAIVAGLTVLRLALVQVPTHWARSTAEILESAMIAVVLVFLVIRPFIVQAYFIPSPSMEPTLLGKNGSGDHILVSKFEYRLHKPRHDDVVVFLAPPAAMAGDPDFIKRLIGIPGDKIQVFGGKLLINGQMHGHGEVREKLAQVGELGEEAKADPDGDLQADHHVKFVADGVMADNKLIPKTRLAEIFTGMPNSPVTVQPGYMIRNGQRLAQPFIAEDPNYDMQIFQGKPLKHDFDSGEYKLEGAAISPPEYAKDVATPTQPIPPHRYLMMGDNRNDSNDSTNWGLLEDRRVVGKAQFIFWPLSRMGRIP